MNTLWFEFVMKLICSTGSLPCVCLSCNTLLCSLQDCANSGFDCSQGMYACQADKTQPPDVFLCFSSNVCIFYPWLTRVSAVVFDRCEPGIVLKGCIACQVNSWPLSDIIVHLQITLHNHYGWKLAFFQSSDIDIWLACPLRLYVMQHIMSSCII